MIAAKQISVISFGGTEKFSGVAPCFIRKLLSDESGGERMGVTAVFRIPKHRCRIAPLLGDFVQEAGKNEPRYKIVAVTENPSGGFPHFRVEAR